MTPTYPHALPTCRTNPDQWDVSEASTPPEQVRQAARDCAACPVQDWCASNTKRQNGWMVASLVQWPSKAGGKKTANALHTAEQYIAMRRLGGLGKTGPKPAEQLAPHGTRAARRRHHRRGEPLCQTCTPKSAPRKVDAATLRRAMAQVPHGTEEGVAAHQEYGGTMCVPCARWLNARQASVARTRQAVAA